MEESSSSTVRIRSQIVCLISVDVRVVALVLMFESIQSLPPICWVACIGWIGWIVWIDWIGWVALVGCWIVLYKDGHFLKSSVVSLVKGLGHRKVFDRIAQLTYGLVPICDNRAQHPLNQDQTETNLYPHRLRLIHCKFN